MAHGQHNAPAATANDGATTLATAFAAEAATFTKIVAGFTIPVAMPFREGDVMTALQARALSAYLLERGASVANSNIDRGSWKELSDDEKVAKVRSYLGGEYKFSDDIGSEVFGESLLDQAAYVVLAETFAAKLTGMDDAAKRKALEPHLARFLNTEGIVEKYDAAIRAAMASILATKHAKRTRNTTPASGVELTF